MRRKGLTAEHRALSRDGCFKTFRIDASLWEFTMLFTLLFTPDTGNIAQDVSEPAAEDIAFIAGHLQWFLDGIRETVACKSKFLKHGGTESC